MCGRGWSLPGALASVELVGGAGVARPAAPQVHAERLATRHLRRAQTHVTNGSSTKEAATRGRAAAYSEGLLEPSKPEFSPCPTYLVLQMAGSSRGARAAHYKPSHPYHSNS
jgi:hypothetical protein